LAKRLSEKEKIDLLKFFKNGKTIDELAVIFDYKRLTIVRHLKKNLGDEKYKELISNRKSVPNSIKEKNTNSTLNKNAFENNEHKQVSSANKSTEESFSVSPFIEITPLNYEIENALQKDLSSIPIAEIEFPDVVYMIVDKKIELEIKYLRDFPEWQFLASEELNRKTIEIFLELKNAKKFCNKEQKVLKVPNPQVFKIVAPLLVSRGISRIVSKDNLIAL